MALLLADALKVKQTPLERGLVEILVQESPVIDRLDFKDAPSGSILYSAEGNLPGVEFRAVNSAYAESTGTYNQESESVVILGGDADVDNFLVTTQGNGEDLLASQAAMKMKAIKYKFQDAFINGDTAVDANSFDGLKKRITGAQVIDAATNGLPVMGADDDDRQAFWDIMDDAIASLPGATPQNTAIYVNRFIKAKMRANMRRLLMSTTTTSTFGKIAPVYTDFPIFDIGTAADGTTLILPQDETMGTSDETSSIYIVKFGSNVEDGGVTGLQANVLKAKNLGELDEKPAQRIRIDWYPGLAVFSGKAAVRIRGILNA